MNNSIRQRIVHVPRRFVAGEWGGTETVILEISRQQQRAGGDPEILTSMALATQRSEEIGGVLVHRFSYTYPFFGLSPEDRAAMDKKGGNLLSLSLFWALLVRPRVRLFHAHALKRLGGEVRTAARLRRKPFVVTLHGGVFDVPEAERQQMMRPIANKPEWGKVFGALFGSRRILDDADQVICVGAGELEKARGHLRHDRIAYLPNGVDSRRFATGDGAAFRQKHQIPSDAFVILNISRIDPQKNQALLLEAFSEFIREQPKAFLVLIGPETQPDYATTLRKLVSDGRLNSSVRLLPGLRNDDPALLQAYHAADVFVLPSRHEPFGIVVLEAWSAGKAVIANHVGGLRALIRDGENGLFISPGTEGTARDLVQRLRSLAKDPELRRRLGESGRAEATGRYDWGRVAAELEALYQKAEAHADLRYGRNSK